MPPILLLVPIAGLALAALRKREQHGRVDIGKPTPGGAAPLPKGRDTFPSTGRPATGSKPRPRNINPVTGKPKPAPVDAPKPGMGNLPIRSPGQPTGPRPGAPIGTVPGGPSVALLERISKALASGDVDAIRALADELRRLGFAEQAGDLDKAAEAIEMARGGGVGEIPTNPGVVIPPPAVVPFPIPLPPLPKPSPSPNPRPRPTPPIVTPSEPFDPDPRRNLALKVQRMLALSPKGSEDTALLKQWQTQEGCKPADGLYGYCSGIAMLKYNLVPPKPRTTLSPQRRKDWTGNLTWQARKDPARAAEYLAAAKLD
jgi:hypothetical protein